MKFNPIELICISFAYDNYFQGATHLHMIIGNESASHLHIRKCRNADSEMISAEKSY